MSETTATLRLCDLIIQECGSKHQLHPLEPNLNEDYNLELTFSVKEIREFLAENGITNLPLDHPAAQPERRMNDE